MLNFIDSSMLFLLNRTSLCLGQICGGQTALRVFVEHGFDPVAAILWGAWPPHILAVGGPNVHGPPLFSAMPLYMAC